VRSLAQLEEFLELRVVAHRNFWKSGFTILRKGVSCPSRSLEPQTCAEQLHACAATDA